MKGNLDKLELQLNKILDPKVRAYLFSKPSIDQLIIDQGFEYAATLVKFWDKVYSVNSLCLEHSFSFNYDFLGLKASHVRELCDETIPSAANRPSAKEVFNNTNYNYAARDYVLRTRYREYYAKLIEPFVEKFHASKHKEYTTLCLNKSLYEQIDSDEGCFKHQNICAEIYNRIGCEIFEPLGYKKSRMKKGFRTWTKTLNNGVRSNIVFDSRGTFSEGIDMAAFSTWSEYIFELNDTKVKYYPSKFTSDLISNIYYNRCYHLWDFELAALAGLTSYKWLHTWLDQWLEKNISAESFY